MDAKLSASTHNSTIYCFRDILGKTYAFEQLEMLHETVNGEQTETRIYQCKTCIEGRLYAPSYFTFVTWFALHDCFHGIQCPSLAANRLGMTVDLQRVKTVNGYFVDIDPGRPRGRAFLLIIPRY